MILRFPVILMEHTEFGKEVIQKAVWCTISVLLIYVNIYYAYYANRCYLAAEIHQSQTISWMLSGISEKAGHFTVFLLTVLNLYNANVFS